MPKQVFYTTQIDACTWHTRYGYLDGLDEVDLSLSGLIGSSKQVISVYLDT